jgi:hypothetical protein
MPLQYLKLLLFSHVDKVVFFQATPASSKAPAPPPATPSAKTRTSRPTTRALRRASSTPRKSPSSCGRTWCRAEEKGTSTVCISGLREEDQNHGGEEEEPTWKRKKMTRLTKMIPSPELRIHEETERGDNDTIKIAGGKTVKIDGKTCKDM